MNAEAIREWLTRQLFQPFEVRLSNGESYQVRHPEVVAVGKNRIAIVDPNTDRFVHVALSTSTASRRCKRRERCFRCDNEDVSQINRFPCPAN